MNQWTVLTRFLEDGELEIDNGAKERANRDTALGRGNWTFFGSDATSKGRRYFYLSFIDCGSPKMHLELRPTFPHRYRAVLENQGGRMHGHVTLSYIVVGGNLNSPLNLFISFAKALMAA